MRYTRETRLEFDGEGAMLWVPEARKQLGILLTHMGFNNLYQLSRSVPYPDGTVINVSSVFGQQTIRITVPTVEKSDEIPSNVALMGDFNKDSTTWSDIIVVRNKDGNWVRLNAAKVASAYGVTQSNIPKGVAWVDADNNGIVRSGNNIVTSQGVLYDAATTMALVEVLGACRRPDGTLVVAGFKDSAGVIGRPVVICYDTDPLVDQASFTPGVQYNILTAVSFSRDATSGVYAWQEISGSLPGGICRIAIADTGVTMTPEYTDTTGFGGTGSSVVSEVTNESGIDNPQDPSLTPSSYLYEENRIYADSPNYNSNVAAVGFVENDEIIIRTSLAGGAAYNYIKSRSGVTPGATQHDIPYPSANIEEFFQHTGWFCYDMNYISDWIYNSQTDVNLTSPTIQMQEDFNGNSKTFASWKVYPDTDIFGNTIYSWEIDSGYTIHVYFGSSSGVARDECGAHFTELRRNYADMIVEVMLDFDLTSRTILTAGGDRSITSAAGDVCNFYRYKGGTRTLLRTITADTWTALSWQPGSGEAYGIVDAVHGGYYGGVRDYLTAEEYGVTGVDGYSDVELSGGNITTLTGVPSDARMTDSGAVLIDINQVDLLI